MASAMDLFKERLASAVATTGADSIAAVTAIAVDSNGSWSHSRSSELFAGRANRFLIYEEDLSIWAFVANHLFTI
jgi:hypothetical protein